VRAKRPHPVAAVRALPGSQAIRAGVGRGVGLA
jgi:hypothetical protein